MWLLCTHLSPKGVLKLNKAIIPNSEWLVLLAAISALVEWGGAVVKLYKVPVAIGSGMAIGDFTECDFSGYAQSATIVWSAPFYDQSLTPVLAGDEKSFLTIFAAPQIYNTVYGYYVTNVAGTHLLFAKAFDAPIILSHVTQGFAVLPAYPAQVAA